MVEENGNQNECIVLFQIFTAGDRFSCFLCSETLKDEDRWAGDYQYN